MDNTTTIGRISPAHIETVAQRAIADGLLQDKAVILHDLSRVTDHINAATQALPQGALHAIAVKANPTLRLLQHVVAAGGGLECASIEEVELSLAAQCPPGNILFDSPAKTIGELRRALALGLVVNADSAEELQRIDEIIHSEKINPGIIGLRINPEVGGGTIAATSVAGPRSRFGVRLKGTTTEVHDLFLQYRWLNALHVHVGSQGCDLSQLVQGAARVVETANDLNKLVNGRIKTIDIGGGLPVAYTNKDTPPTFAEYGIALRAAVPQLYDGSYRVITEFGRAIQANCGTTLSRVEYVKSLQGSDAAVIHVGADMFVRPVYAAHDWVHEFIALDTTGKRKTGPQKQYAIVGPLCFGGDIVAQSVELPELSPGDVIAIRDTGAYTVSLWSRHCNRGIPEIVGYKENGQKFELLRAAESPSDIVNFWRGS